MKILLLTISLLMIFSSSVLAQKNTSIYTSLTTEGCKTLESDEEGTGWYRGLCKGTGGYSLELTEGDLRQSLIVIAPNKKRFDLNFMRVSPRFSSIGEKAEWRMKGKTPVALIVRYRFSSEEDETKSVSYLIVTKLSGKESCITDIVKASKTQNAEAQKLADAAATRPCHKFDE